MRNIHVATLLLAISLLAGCASTMNPAFPLERHEARAAIAAMADDPKPLERPLVVMGGWLDPGLVVNDLVRAYRRVSGSEDIVGVSFAFASSFDACRKRVFDAVDELFPENTVGASPEVDVVAFSMGGLIAREAAMTGEDGRHLTIRRLFTISSPHRGAALAGLPTFDRLQIDMRAGSDYLTRLDGTLSEATYELIPYVRLGDRMVGSRNAAPAGMVPWWVPNPPLGIGHSGAFRDERIVADIMRRLRGEPPWTRHPRAPLPG